MKPILTLLSAFFFLMACQSSSKKTEKTTLTAISALDFQAQLDSFAKTKNAEIGLAIFGDNDSFFINADKHFIMMSVIKFPQALYLMHLVNENKLSLNQIISFDSIELKRQTWSPLGLEHPYGTYQTSLMNSLYYSVGQSDNVVCDKLYDLASFKEIEHYFRSIGAKDFGINFKYQHLKRDSIHRNYSSPRAMAKILNHFQIERSKGHSAMDSLWHIMATTNTGKMRLKAGLPSMATLAHKTGTFFEDSTHIEALNDVGIVVLPNQKQYKIVVFVNHSKEGSNEATEAIISELNRMAYGYFNQAKSEH